MAVQRAADPAVYYRPIVQSGARYGGALSLAGGALWFREAERLERGCAARIIPARDIPDTVLHRLTAPRPPVCGLSLERARLMGILNATPDSFSDGGQYDGFAAGIAHGRLLVENGADILDIGGESTRPGADYVDAALEIERTAPLIAALADAGVPISIDTRKADVADAALGAGAGLVNDVSALGFDPAMAALVARAGVPVCLMHARGDPKTMQRDPVYENVLLDVFDALAEKLRLAMAAGIARARIVVDPGIGFGKTEAHNLALIRGISLFHGLGCAVLLGVSRKRFIGRIGGLNGIETPAAHRAPGSIALALEGLAQGVQILRVHDISETRQAVALWRAVHLPNSTKAT